MLAVAGCYVRFVLYLGCIVWLIVLVGDFLVVYVIWFVLYLVYYVVAWLLGRVNCCCVLVGCVWFTVVGLFGVDFGLV